MATKKTSKKSKPVAKGKIKPTLKPKVTKNVKPAKVAKKVTPKKLDKVTKVFTKGELYSILAEKAGISRKQVVSVFDSLSEVIAAHLKKDGPEKFVLPGLLKIVIKKVPAKPAREGKNPFTGEMMMFKAKPASKKVKVLALRHLKEMC
jgi:nucleoid DNA-binding protein